MLINYEENKKYASVHPFCLTEPANLLGVTGRMMWVLKHRPGLFKIVVVAIPKFVRQCLLILSTYNVPTLLLFRVFICACKRIVKHCRQAYYYEQTREGKGKVVKLCCGQMTMDTCNGEVEGWRERG